MAASLNCNVAATWNGSGIAECMAARINRTGERIVHSGGTDAFLTYHALVKKDTGVTVISDSPTVLTLTRGTSATLAVTWYGAGASNVTATGTCMLLDIEGGGAHASVDSHHALSFAAVSSDGSTDPVSVS